MFSLSSPPVVSAFFSAHTSASSTHSLPVCIFLKWFFLCSSFQSLDPDKWSEMHDAALAAAALSRRPHASRRPPDRLACLRRTALRITTAPGTQPDQTSAAAAALAAAAGSPHHVCVTPAPRAACGRCRPCHSLTSPTPPSCSF